MSPRQVTLHASAELDARRVNQYTLTLRAACPGEDEVEERLFIRVTVGQALRCDTPFASAGRSGGYRAVGAVGASRHWAPTAMLCCRRRHGAGASGRGALDAPVRGAAAAPWRADGEWWLPWEPAEPASESSPGDSRTPGVERGTGVPTLLTPLISLQFRLQNHDTPLRLTHRGLVLAPASGFDPSKDTQVGTSNPRLSQPPLSLQLSVSCSSHQAPISPQPWECSSPVEGFHPLLHLKSCPSLIPIPIPVPIWFSSSSSSPSQPLFTPSFLPQDPFSSLFPFPFLFLSLFLPPIAVPVTVIIPIPVSVHIPVPGATWGCPTLPRHCLTDI